MKHFEDVWLEAEDVSSESKSISNSVYDVRDRAGDLIKHYERATGEDGSEEAVKEIAGYVGGILFDIAHICKEFNINSWAELQNTVNFWKIELNDKGEDV